MSFGLSFWLRSCIQQCIGPTFPVGEKKLVWAPSPSGAADGDSLTWACPRVLLGSLGNPGSCWLSPTLPLPRPAKPQMTAVPCVEPLLGLLPLCCTINIYNHLISLSSSFINREFLQNHLYRQALIWLFGIICISAGRARGPGSVTPAEVSGTEASGLALEILKPQSREQEWEEEGLALLPPSPRRSEAT